MGKLKSLPLGSFASEVCILLTYNVLSVDRGFDRSDRPDNPRPANSYTENENYLCMLSSTVTFKRFGL